MGPALRHHRGYGRGARSITNGLRRGRLMMIGPPDATATGEIEQLVDILVRIMPAGAAIGAMMMLTLNLWVGAKMTATSGRLHRPWPDLKITALPPLRLAALFAAIA